MRLAFGGMTAIGPLFIDHCTDDVGVISLISQGLLIVKVLEEWLSLCAFMALSWCEVEAHGLAFTVNSNLRFGAKASLAITQRRSQYVGTGM